MGENYKTCELHEKPFPHNLIDTTKVEMTRLYLERKEEIEGKNITLTMFVGAKNENEGIDVCAQCMQEKILSKISEKPLFKGVSWDKVTMQKKDGSGTYEKNVKVVETQEEITERLKAEAKAIAQAPKTK